MRNQTLDLLALLRARVRRPLSRLVQAETREALQDLLPLLPQLTAFHHSAPEERQSYWDHTKDPIGNLPVYARLSVRLAQVGVPVEEARVDPDDFRRWLRAFAPIRDRYRGAGAFWLNHCLQHYLAVRYLDLTTEDIHIDVGGAGSPLADVLNKKGVRAYRLDLCYQPGIHGANIGADATDTKLPDGFASALSSQDAFVVFDGDGDKRFVKEAGRILSSRGRCTIIPLYLDDTHFVTVSPYADLKRITVDSGARRVWRDDGVDVPFARHYSPEAFKERVYMSLPEDMAGKVFFFTNLDEMMAAFPGQLAYCFFMFYSEKRGRSSPIAGAPREAPLRPVPTEER